MLIFSPPPLNWTWHSSKMWCNSWTIYIHSHDIVKKGSYIRIYPAAKRVRSKVVGDRLIQCPWRTRERDSPHTGELPTYLDHQGLTSSGPNIMSYTNNNRRSSPWSRSSTHPIHVYYAAIYPNQATRGFGSNHSIPLGLRPEFKSLLEDETGTSPRHQHFYVL